MKRLAAAGFAVALVAASAVFAQEELDFAGRYEDARKIIQPTDDTDQIVFARLIYNGRIPGYYKNWYTDYPKGDHQLIEGIQRLTNLNLADHERAIALTDPALFKYPLIYSSEVGQMVLDAKDAAIMREYLDRGGFWFVDDFWGSFEWNSFMTQLRKIYPEPDVRDIPQGHPIFHIFFEVEKVMQVPSLAYLYNGGITYETDGFTAECKGLWDKQGRLVAVINHNTDLGDAYEWMDEPRYPYRFSTYAYRIAVNIILYALTN